MTARFHTTSTLPSRFRRRVNMVSVSSVTGVLALTAAFNLNNAQHMLTLRGKDLRVLRAHAPTHEKKEPMSKAGMAKVSMSKSGKPKSAMMIGKDMGMASKPQKPDEPQSGPQAPPGQPAPAPGSVASPTSTVAPVSMPTSPPPAAVIPVTPAPVVETGSPVAAIPVTWAPVASTTAPVVLQPEPAPVDASPTEDD